MVTGEASDSAAVDEEESSTALKWKDKPLLVYVCSDEPCSDSEKFESVALKNEKLALGMRAFRCVRMSAEQIGDDPVFAEKGKTLPRILLIDPIKLKAKVIESKDLSATKIFRTMKRVSASFWKEKLDTVVGKHLKLLTEQDRLANAEKTLAAKQARAKDNEKKSKKIQKERDEIKEDLARVAKDQVELWKLTPKHREEKA